jgi:hypothetical protein
MNRSACSAFSSVLCFVCVGCTFATDDAPASGPQPRDDVASANPDASDGDAPDTDAPAPPPAPTMMVATRDTVVWKRHRTLENDLLRALSLTKSQLCREVETFSCIDEAHLAALGGNSPIELAHYVPVPAPTVTTPMAVERVVLAGCSRRAELDAALPIEARLLFTAFPLETGTVVDASALDALGTTLYRRFLARDPLPEELAALQPLRDGGTAALDVAKLTCFAIGSTVEFAFQ